MSISSLLNLDVEIEDLGPCIPPPQVPVTILDMDRIDYCIDMHLPMADPCPLCKGHNMVTGDYVCWGACSKCAYPYEGY